jgi:uncharacterized RDD family membrane protein YckC
MTYPNNPDPAGQYPPPGQMPPPGQYPSAPPAPAGYGQAGPPGTWYDQQSGLNLPQGTQLAPVGRRIGAYFLSIPLVIVTLGIGYLIWGLILWGQGTTPALKVLGMRVYKPQQGRVATWGTMALREIVGRIVDGILWIITMLVSFIMFVSGKEHQSLHDKVAGTVVLHDPNKTLG